MLPSRRRAVFAAVALASVLFVFAGAPASAQLYETNLLTNPGAESGTIGWGRYRPGTSALLASTTNPRTGSRSWKANGASASLLAQNVSMSQFSAPIAAGTAQVSASLYAIGPSEIWRLQLSSIDGSGEVTTLVIRGAYAVSSAYTQSTTGWRAIPDDAVGIEVMIGWYGGVTNSFIDDVELLVRNTACEEGPQAPALVRSNITAAGDAVMAFESAALLSSLSWNFVGGTGCDNDGIDTTGGWVHNSNACPPTHTLTKPVAELLATCGFSAAPVDGGDTWYYEAVAEATAVNNTSVVFGDDQTRTDLTSFRLRVEFPKNVSVIASTVIYGPIISIARVTTQAADTSVVPAGFSWTLATSVQHPYELVAPATTDATPAGFDAALAVAGPETCAGTAVECTQRFTVSGTASGATCQLDGSAALTFTVKCRDGFTGSCDLPVPATVAASFSFETDDFCPQVVEVASITPSLTTYSDSGRTSVSTNYILGTTMFARVTADVEAGLLAKRTTLTGLDIVSSCSTCTPLVQPFTDMSAALTDYNFQYVADGTDNSATSGEVETDFSFTLNTNSLSFDNDAATGEAQITLTAYVSVEYDTPSEQGLKRSYRVQAVSGPGSIGSSATAQASVSGSSAGTTSGSSSTAGSTVFGVTTGTVALAAVGVAVVAAVAFGAALSYRRRRRRPPAAKRSSSSASLEIESTPTRVPDFMPTHDLAAVQTGYASVRVSPTAVASQQTM